MLKTNLRRVLSEHLRTVGGLAELKADRGQGLSKRLSINATISLWEVLRDAVSLEPCTGDLT